MQEVMLTEKVQVSKPVASIEELRLTREEHKFERPLLLAEPFEICKPWFPSVLG